MRRIALLLSLCAVSAFGQKPAPQTLTYRGELPAADAAVRVFTLVLRPNGVASLYQDYAGKGTVADNGKWKRTRSGEVQVRFVPHEGKKERAAPITWEEHDGKLVPKKWDKSAWGESGPPTLTPVKP